MTERLRRLGILFIASLIVTSCNRQVKEDNKNSVLASSFLEAKQETEDRPSKWLIFQVDWRICGKVRDLSGQQDANGCIKSFSPLYLWGEVGEAKLVKTGYSSLQKADVEDAFVAIASRGCFPRFQRPQEEQLYSTERIVFVEKGTEPKIEIIKTHLTERQVNDILLKKRSLLSIAASEPSCMSIKVR